MTESKKRVLIIDDEEDIRSLLGQRFEDKGFDVDLAPEGKSGFEQACANTPDCILLDIRVEQGEDGLTFLRKLRSFRHEDASFEQKMRSLPVVVLTAVGLGIKDLIEVEGVSGFYVKPYDPDKIIENIKEVLSS